MCCLFLTGLPISGSAKSSTTLSSATPSVDRYAALKDLDDQFREIKFENETNNNNTNGTSSSTASSGLINGNHANDVHQGMCRTEEQRPRETKVLIIFCLLCLLQYPVRTPSRQQIRSNSQHNRRQR